MFLIVLFPLLALGTLAAVAILGDAQHEDRWVLNERHACCEERAISKQLTSNFVSSNNRKNFMEFEPADVAA
jgi:hypothetical protein